MGLAEHRARSPSGIRCAVITVSDSRDLETDESGKDIVRRLEVGGHRAAARCIVPDDATRIAAELRRCLADAGIDAIVLNGGTGIAPRDGTTDVVRAFLEVEIPGFGEFFRSLSRERIGTAAMLSRALAGVARGKPVFCLPGSPDAVALGMDELILPELGHIIEELRRR